jgi:Rho-binding antiterminator
MKPHGYRPISCSLHDRLEAAAVMRARCALHYETDAGECRTVEVRITDVVTREGAEFVVLDSGDSVRADRIRRLDGHPFESPPETGTSS